MDQFFAELADDLFGGCRRHIVLRLLRIMLLERGNKQAVVLIRIAQLAHRRGWRRIGWAAARRLRREFGCFIKSTARIGPGLKLPHPHGIVIGADARIGARCVIYHQVTLGGRRAGDWQAARYPAVGDDVTLFAGVKLLGSVNVGDRARIGANAVVTHDVPADHSAAGVPARTRPLDGETFETLAASGLVEAIL